MYLNKLYIIICVDCDPDRLQYGGKKNGSFREPHIWNGVKIGIPKLKAMLKDIGESEQNSIKFTWFVRSDLEMKEIYGDAAWPLRYFSEIWDGLKQSGDEIAWHVHLGRWCESERQWYQEINDTIWMQDCLEKSFDAYYKALGVFPKTCRSGWSFQNIETLKKLSELRLIADFSALPGMMLPGYKISRNRLLSKLDWSNTQEKPYFPSEADYRRPARNNEKPLSILEFPVSMFRSNLFAASRNIRSTFRFGFKNVQNYPKGNLLVSMITLNPLILKNCIQLKFKESKEYGSTFLVLCFHLDDLLPSKPIFSNYILSAQNAMDNIKRITSLSKKFNIQIDFLTATEAAKLFLHDKSQEL